MRKLIRRHLPDPHSLRQYRLFALLGDVLLHPNLWHLNRHSAARGVAIGLFCGLIPGPLQMLGAALVCLVWRANLPLALITTFYTNPLTIVPLYLVAYTLGAALLGIDRPFVPPPHLAGSTLGAWLDKLAEWFITLGKPLALGLPLLATLLAVAGWCIVKLAWRWHVVHQWRHRHRGSRMTTTTNRPGAGKQHED